jgi:hypothetical protein
MSRKEGRADLSIVGTEEDVEVPKADLVSRPPAATPPETSSSSEGKTMPEENRLTTPSTGIVLNSNLSRLAERYAPSEEKAGIHFRVAPGLKRYIDEQFFELKKKSPKLTKDAFAEDVFMKYFGLKRPPS